MEKTTKFCLRYAQSLPQLAIDKTNVNWLGADLAEVTVTISNDGYLPTYLSREAKLLGTARPVKVSLQGQIDSFIAGAGNYGNRRSGRLFRRQRRVSFL